MWVSSRTRLQEAIANVKYLYIAYVTSRSDVKPEKILEEGHLINSKVS